MNNIILYPIWVPREENNIADAISKEDTDNWSIDGETFRYIQSVYGPFTMDRFADNINRKVGNFNSKYHCPGSNQVNAFSITWKDDFNWLCQPIRLNGRSNKFLKMCRGKAVLSFPCDIHHIFGHS